MVTIDALYNIGEITLDTRKSMAAAHPELLLYLLTVSRIDRTGSISGKEPLGHLILGSYVRMVGWDVRIYAGSIYEALDVLRSRREDDANRKVLVGIYCDYENLEAVVSLASRLHAELGYPILLGGPQAIALDEAFVRRFPFVDAFIRGDGEHSLPDVLAAYAAGHPEARFSVHGVCGLLKDEYVDGGFSDPLTDMDESPSTSDADMIFRGPRVSLAALSGRGCPFHCAFCYEGGNSKTVRLRSVEHMMRELERRFEEHPEAKYVYFGDDTFTLQPKRLRQFCEALKALRKKHDFIWFADGHVRVLLAHPEYLPMMIDAGLCRMQIGIESTCQPIIDLYNKNVRKEEFYRVLDMCLEAGLPQLVGNIIIGGAMETEASIRETFDTIYDLLRRSRGILDVTSTLYSNFPGTAMSRAPENFGLNILDPDGLTSFGDYPIARTAELSLDRIAQLRREFIVNTQRVMRECVKNGEVDDWRIMQTFKLQQRYGLTNMWYIFGMPSNNLKRFYTYNSAYGTAYGKLRDVDSAIPVRTMFLSGERDYLKPIPSLDGYPVSPFESELVRLCAGKLTVGEICARLWVSHGDAFSDENELRDFALNRMKALNDRRMLVFTEMDSDDHITNGGERRQMPEINGCDASAKNKVLLFYPYGVAESWEMTGATQGIYILAAVLKDAGYEARACECVFNRIPGYIRAEGLENVRAVGLSMTYENRRLALRLSRMISEDMGIPVIIGGVDARTVTGEELLSSGACAVIKGEGEITLPRVIESLDDPAALEQISGLLLTRRANEVEARGLNAVWSQDADEGNWRMVDTGAEEPPLDLDQVPFPDYSLSLTPHPGKVFRIMTSRGCPNHCAFCHEGTHKTRLRMRSIPNVLREVRSILEQYPHLSHIYFCDDTLVTDERRVRELCDGLKALQQERGQRLNWYCEADIWSLYKNPNLIPMMIDAGLLYLQVGIESGDDDMLALYEKKLTTDMVRQVVRQAYEAGLAGMCGPILVGAPFENRAHIEREKAYIRELVSMAPGMMQMLCSVIVPYPQTRLGREPEHYGYTFTDKAGDTSNTDYPAYHTETMSEKDILAAYQELTDEYIALTKELIGLGKVPFEQLKRIVMLHQNFGDVITWGVALNGYFPIIYSYFQLLIRCGVSPLRELPRQEMADWHIQRAFEIWRFVNVSGVAPTLEGYVLSPYEYQIILYAAGKLRIRDIAERMYPAYGSGDSREAFLDRILDTVLFFESKYWLVGVPY